MIVPTLKYERRLWHNGARYVTGVDEVGRGALAGPVVAAAVVFDPSHTPIPGIRDSKTLSKLQKNNLQQKIIACCAAYSLGEASALEIDQLGIVAATALAMERALQELQADHLLIDGLPFKNQSLLDHYQKTFIVKGDAHSYSIAAASIIAKVHRDTIMKNFAVQYPQFAFEKNVGYGSAQHRTQITQCGFCDLHRKSFLKKY